MGTIVMRGDKFRAVIRITGHKPVTKTFPNRQEAKRWMLITEAKTVVQPKISRHGGSKSLSWVLSEAREAALKIPHQRPTASAMLTLISRAGDVMLEDCTEAFWYGFGAAIDATPATRAKYFSMIKGALTLAEFDHKVNINWFAFKDAVRRLRYKKLIGRSKSRSRRASADEIAAIKAAWGHMVSAIPLPDIIDFALVTAMRRGEIFRITRDDFNERTKMQMIRDRKDPQEKIGNDMEIPLLGDAPAIIKRQPKVIGEPRIFPFNMQSVSNLFRYCAAVAGVEGLRLHDLRHEALSRLFEQGFTIPEVCNVSGHESWECLRIYTQIKGEDMHKGPISRRAA